MEKELPSMETLVSLEEFRAEGSVNLKSIRGLELAAKLLKLIVNGSSELMKLSSMDRPSGLKKTAMHGQIGIFEGVVGRRTANVCS